MQSVTCFVRYVFLLAPILALRAQPAGDSVSISGTIYDVISSADDGRLMVTVARDRTQYMCIIPGTDKAATKVWNALDIDQPISFAGIVVSTLDRQRLLGRYFSVPHEGNFRNVILHPCRITPVAPIKPSPTSTPSKGGGPMVTKPRPTK